MQSPQDPLVPNVPALGNQHRAPGAPSLYPPIPVPPSEARMRQQEHPSHIPSHHLSLAPCRGGETLWLLPANPFHPITRVPTPELKTSGRDGPKTAGAWGRPGPGEWQSEPGAMLRRRERTARWRRARGGGRAPPRSRGPGTEDCSKTLPRPGVFRHHLQDGGRLVTHCANACSRGATREALR